MVRDDKMFLGPLAGSMSPQSGETSAMTYSTLPEVTTGPPMDYYGRDKLDAAEAKAEGSIPVATENSPTICGLKKKTFFIILAVAIIVIAGAIAGGVAGGLTANNSSNSDSDADTDSSGDTHDSNDDNENSATKTTVGSPGPTGPTAPEDRAMAASTSSDFNVQLFYQDLNTTDILYRRIQDDKAADEKTLDLDIEPQWGSSIAATVLNGSDHISARVFYVTIDEGSRQVAQATLECEADGETCSTKSNSIISANMTGDIHPNTKLSALYLRDDFVRVFYQAGGGHIWVLTNDGDDDKWGQTHMVSRAYPGSGIVAAAPNDDDIHLFFVSGESERLRFMVYSDILGADDDRSINDSPGTTWSPTASLTGVYVPKSDPYRIYYAPPDGGAIVSFWQPLGKENTWNRNHNDAWGKVEGGFASAAWSDQVRIYYFQDGELVVSAQDNTTWAEVKSL